MTTVTCERCGTEFDTERDPATAGASGERCPSCGKSHEPAELADNHDDGGDAPANEAAGVTVRITIEVYGANGVDIGASK